jgi:O-antigen/teichoic acid export membrane protein
MRYAIKRHFNQIYNDQLFRNAFYILLDTFFGSLLGLIFWILSARLYSPETIGIITTVISVQYIIIRLSLLGFDTSTVRYLPKSKNKSAILGNAFLVTGSLTLVFSIIYILFFNHGPTALLLNNSLFGAIFVVSTLFYMFFLLVESVFLSYRKTHLTLLKNAASNIIKILLSLLLVVLGAAGLFFSWTIALAFPVIIVASVYGIPALKIHFQELKNMAAFGFSNYLASGFSASYRSILQVVIAFSMGVVASAHFFLMYTAVSILYFVSDGFAQSLFVEGSYSNKKLFRLIVRGVLYSIAAIIPLVLVYLIFWQRILLLFGEEYLSIPFNAFAILVLSAIPCIFYHIYISVLRIRKKNMKLVLINFIFFSTVITGSMALLGFGLVGISAAVLIGYVSTNIFAITDIALKWKKKNN